MEDKKGEKICGVKLPLREEDDPLSCRLKARYARCDIAEQFQPISLLTLERSSETGIGFAT